MNLNPSQVAAVPTKEAFEDAIDSYFVTSEVSTGKYDDDEWITCRSQFRNNRVCGKQFRKLGDFIKHLERANVHKTIEEE